MSDIFNAARSILSKFQPPLANPQPNSNKGTVIGDPQKMKLKVGISKNFINEAQAQQPEVMQPVPTPTAIPQIIQQAIQPSQWQSKYQQIYNKVVPQKKLNQNDVRVLVTSENGKEDPGYQNFNYDKTGKPISVDTGLLQVNTPLNSPEISKLKDPEYAINKGLGILQQRNQLLEDPVLAIASYNLGAGGAVLNPEKALNRAKVIYKNAGVPLPETEFTRDPKGFVNRRMETYKKYGLFK